MAQLVQCMQELGYHSCNADPDLWMKAWYRLTDKWQYNLYMLCYVDDILCIHYYPDDVLKTE